MQIGSIFKTINVYESLIVFCTDEGLHFAELRVSDLSLVHKPQMVLF